MSSTSKNSKNIFWLKEPLILLNKECIPEIWPLREYSLERKLNAITRLILLLTFIGYFFTRSLKIVVSAVITLVVLVIIYRVEKNKKNAKDESKKEKEGEKTKEGLAMMNINNNNYTQSTVKNPLMNVLPTDYTDNPSRNRAAPSYDENVSKKILDNAKDLFKKSVCNKKLFQDLGENLTFQQSMRNFHTNPSTTIPNDQESFMSYCYGNMQSRKETHSNNA